VTDTVEPAENAASEDLGAAGFVALGLDERLLRTLAALGYEEPTPVQRSAIPPLLSGKDLLAEAPTGTGKTPRSRCRSSSGSPSAWTRIEPRVAPSTAAASPATDADHVRARSS